MPCPRNLNCESAIGESEDLTLSNPDYHPYIIHAMIDKEGHQKDFRPAVLDLTREKDITDELCLAKHGIIGTMPDLWADTSFSRQMHQVTRNQPDAFVAPYRSGIPLLAAV